MIKTSPMTPNAANILLKALSRLKLSRHQAIPCATVFMRNIDMQGVCQFEDSYSTSNAFIKASEELKYSSFWLESHTKHQLLQYYFVNGEGFDTYCTYYFHQFIYDEIETVECSGDLKPYLKQLGLTLCR